MRWLKEIGVLLFIFGFGLNMAHAQARIVSGGGRIEVVRQGAATVATPNQALSLNDRIRTGNGAFATVELTPGNRLVLGEQTEVEVGDVAPVMRISLERGSVEVFSNSRIAVRTKDGEFTSTGNLLNMNLSYRDSKLILTIARGSVDTAGLTSNVMFSAVNNPETRTYIAGGRHGQTVAVEPYAIYPYVYLANPWPYGPTGH